MSDAVGAARATTVLVVALAARAVLDVAIGPGAQVATVALVCAVAIAAARPSAWRRAPELAGMVAIWGVVLLVGLIRAPDLGEGAAMALRYASGPLLAVAAVGASRDVGARAPVAVAVGSIVPILLSYAVWVSGDLVLQAEHWRLAGAYAFVLALASAMSLLVILGAVLAVAASDGRLRVAGAVLAATSGPLLAASGTRAAVLFAAIGVGAALVALRRTRGAALGALLFVGVVAAVPVLRERVAELVSAARGVAPDQGWLWLGTGRVAIWSRSFEAFRDLPVADQALGTGLAGYAHFWKGKDPHHEYLVLLYQLGPIGVVAYGAPMVWGVLRGWRVARRGGEDAVAGALVVGIGVAALVAGATSSVFLTRLTLTWTFWLLVGSVWVAGRPSARS